MRPLVLLGIILIVTGLLALAYPVITYIDRDKVVDAGPLEITTATEESVPIPPIVGGLALVGGIGLLVIGQVRRR